VFETKNVEALLRSAILEADDKERRAKCLFSVRPLTPKLAGEISEHVESYVFHAEHSEQYLKSMAFDLKIPRQWLTFAQHPDLPTTGGRIRNVDIGGIQVVRHPKLVAGQFEFRLLFEARFVIIDKAVTSKLVIDCLKQPVYLTFEIMQKELPLGADSREQLSGEFINRRARDRQLGFGIPPHVRGGVAAH
jgi:hypothetical protein